MVELQPMQLTQQPVYPPQQLLSAEELELYAQAHRPTRAAATNRSVSPKVITIGAGGLAECPQPPPAETLPAQLSMADALRPESAPPPISVKLQATAELTRGMPEVEGYEANVPEEEAPGNHGLRGKVRVISAEKRSGTKTREGSHSPSAAKVNSRRRLAAEAFVGMVHTELPVEELLMEQLRLQQTALENCRRVAHQYAKQVEDVVQLEVENAMLRKENERLNTAGGMGDVTTLRDVAHSRKKRNRAPMEPYQPLELSDAYAKVALAANGRSLIPGMIGEGIEESPEGMKLGSTRTTTNRRGSIPSMSARPTMRHSMRSMGSAARAGAKKVEFDSESNEEREMKATKSVRGSVKEDEEEETALRKALEGRNPVFPDRQQRKQRMRETLSMPAQEGPQDGYYDTGLFQAVARHRWFEYCTLFVIGLNAIWQSIDSDLNQEEVLLNAHPVFIIAENVFCTLFFIEISVRFFALKVKSSCCRDLWFLFDAALVSMTVVETWVLPLVIPLFAGNNQGGGGGSSTLRILRLLRLSRMARMVRLVRAMPELLVMIKAIGAAIRSVAITLFLLAIIVYVYAIALSQLLVGSELGDSKFRTVPESMNTLFVDGVLPDHGSIVEEALGVHWFFWIAIVSYLLLTFITLMNMLVGILCEVVSVVSGEEKEERLLQFVHHEISAMLPDRNGDGVISKDEFEELLDNPRAIKVLKIVGVDVDGLESFKDFIFYENSHLSFADFMDVVLQLRSSNLATVKDIVDLRKCMHQEFKVLRDIVKVTE
eukprot:TRINITY_DN14301_c0_g1_i1.p1 TRINITY_DN14301_c0_g1~~TRINITY_DN14301_c0_g1_i1.p1  ORF type:complete len:772 (-),score=205.30 TRINITY_DN14301_c0_g1_i1:80-2395(-)